MKNKNLILLISIVILLITFLSCGPTPSVEINESNVTVYTDKTFQFTATVTNANDTSVTWSVSSSNDADKGSIDANGLYTAVSTDILPANTVTVTVTATSVEDNSVTTSTDITVEKRIHLVYDIRSGSDNSSPLGLTVFNDKLYFKANDGINGNELWEYDGINEPAMVYDICSGGSSSGPLYFTVFNDRLYFRANDNTNGEELWEYDGTSDPTMVHDINIGAHSSPRSFTVFNDKLYFSANNGIKGYELWEYDGTNDPAMVYDINTGGDNSSPHKNLPSGCPLLQLWGGKTA